jgi:mitogen-activated protein kinase binding protein 1
VPNDEEKQGLMFKDMTDAIRCVKVSPNGKTLACGDWLGNIRVYDLTNPDSVEQQRLIEAHNMEIICLAFSPKIGASDRFWLASGSRDKLITVFDTSQEYEAVTVLEHHTSSIHSLQFTTNKENRLNLISCGADRTIVKKVIDVNQVESFKTFEQLQLASASDQVFT